MRSGRLPHATAFELLFPSKPRGALGPFTDKASAGMTDLASRAAPGPTLPTPQSTPWLARITHSGIALVADQGDQAPRRLRPKSQAGGWDIRLVALMAIQNPPHLSGAVLISAYEACGRLLLGRNLLSRTDHLSSTLLEFTFQDVTNSDVCSEDVPRNKINLFSLKLRTC